MPPYDEQELADLLRALKPPPEDWAEAARQVPRIQRQLDQVLPTLEAESAARSTETEALERAISEAGIEPAPQLVAALKRHLEHAGE